MTERSLIHNPPRPLAHDLTATRVYAPDRDFQLAALRVVLGLPRRLGRSGGIQ